MVRTIARTYNGGAVAERDAGGGRMGVETVGSPALFVGFIALVLALLAADLGLFRRKSTELSLRAAALYTLMWVSFAALFGLWVSWRFGVEPAAQYATGYVVEEALSVDNVFVFSVILTFFAVPKGMQHRVLYWGILGALVLRGMFIGAGAALVHTFEWVLYVFGVVLVFTGVKLVFHDDDDVDPSKNILVRIARYTLPFVDGYRGDRFFVRENGKWFATPLLIVLVAVEGTDVLFAFDSIPAIFAITQDPFIVYTSNIFAILGLRSLYFLVAGMVERFKYLKYGLSVILVFVGAKMLIHGLYDVPTLASLVVIFAVLAVSVVVSWLWAPPRAAAADHSPPE